MQQFKLSLLVAALLIFPLSLWAGDSVKAIQDSLEAFKKAGSSEVSFTLGMKMGEKTMLLGGGKIQYSSPTLIRTEFKEQQRKITTTSIYHSSSIYQGKTRGQITVHRQYKLGLELKDYSLAILEALWEEDRNLVGLLTIHPPMMLKILQSYSNLKMAKGAKGFLVFEGTPKPSKEQGALRPWDPLGMPCEIYLDEKTYLPVKILWKNIRNGKLRGVFALEYSKYQMGKKIDPALFKGPSEKEEITVRELPKGWHLKKGDGDKKGKESKPATKKEFRHFKGGLCRVCKKSYKECQCKDKGDYCGNCGVYYKHCKCKDPLYYCKKCGMHIALCKCKQFKKGEKKIFCDECKNYYNSTKYKFCPCRYKVKCKDCRREFSTPEHRECPQCKKHYEDYCRGCGNYITKCECKKPTEKMIFCNKCKQKYDITKYKFCPCSYQVKCLRCKTEFSMLKQKECLKCKEYFKTHCRGCGNYITKCECKYKK